MCNECHSFLTDINKFVKRAKKINYMFNEITSVEKSRKYLKNYSQHLNNIRSQYGLDPFDKIIHEKESFFIKTENQNNEQFVDESAGFPGSSKDPCFDGDSEDSEIEIKKEIFDDNYDTDSDSQSEYDVKVEEDSSMDIFETTTNQRHETSIDKENARKILEPMIDSAEIFEFSGRKFQIVPGKKPSSLPVAQEILEDNTTILYANDTLYHKVNQIAYKCSNSKCKARIRLNYCTKNVKYAHEHKNHSYDTDSDSQSEKNVFNVKVEEDSSMDATVNQSDDVGKKTARRILEAMIESEIFEYSDRKFQIVPGKKATSLPVTQEILDDNTTILYSNDTLYHKVNQIVYKCCNSKCKARVKLNYSTKEVKYAHEHKNHDTNRNNVKKLKTCKKSNCKD